MKKIFDQIIVVPIVILYYLIGLYLAIRNNIEINNYVYAAYIITGLLIKYVRSIYPNKKIVNVICSLITFILFVVAFYEPIVALIKGVYDSIMTANIMSIILTLGRVFNKKLLPPTLYYLSFILIRCIYQDVIVEKKVAVFSGFALIICFGGWLVSGKIYDINIFMIALALMLRICRSSYNNLNSLGGIKAIVISLLFVCCLVAMYLLSPYVENINIKLNITKIINNVEDVANSIVNQGEQSLDGELGEMKMMSEGEELSDEIIMTIDTSFNIDRLKAYSCGSYDVKKNAFVIDKKIKVDVNNNYSNLFIKQNSTPLPEYLHVVVNKKIDDVVYVPYGDLSFSKKAYLYNDQVVQFKNDEDYSNYSLTFNPSEYYVNTLNTNDILSKYKTYSFNNYANSSNEKILPTPIRRAIEAFINEDSKYQDYYITDESLNAQIKQGNTNVYNDRLNVYRINDYLKAKFIIKESYDKNTEGLDDISYALTKNHVVNPQLMAAIATFMYRYENIPSRFVVGYSVEKYEGNTAYIRENNKTYWSEVFIDGQWVPADDLFLPVGNGTKTESLNNSQDAGLDSMSGDLKDTFDDFSNDKKIEEETIALTIETNYEVDRVKQTSYGDYNSEEHKFEYEENINNYNSIKKADTVYDMNNFFKNIFVVAGNYKYYMKITNNISTNNAYVPYGNINIQNVSMYQDKELLFSNNEYSYLVNFEPYSNENHFKSNSFYDDYVYEKYLSVPNEMIKELQDFLISKGIDYKSQDKALLIRQIKNLLQGKEYTYTLEPGEVPAGKDMLLYFLLDNKQGFCQHFAGAATLLYRICGIPSRYTVGFSIDNYENGVAKVTTQDAHAWTEVYTKNYGWKPIEVTGSSEHNESDLSDIETEYTSIDLGTQYNNEGTLDIKNSKFNIQPDFSLSNQEIVNGDYTMINKEYENQGEDEPILLLSTNHELFRIKAYSLGNYNVEEQDFYLGEDLSSQKDIKKISSLFDINQFFIPLFTNKESQEYEFTAKTNNEEKWIYVPYGTLNINNANMYQDKYYYFDDEEEYNEYSLTYSLYDQENIFDKNHDYENFVYNYYTEVPYDFKSVLDDFLKEKEIDINDEDKLSIIKKIQELLSTKYIYTENENKKSDEVDSTLDFVIRSRKGNDKQFVNGAVMLYRMCGIPSRHVDGLYLGEYIDGNYELYNSDKHSWVEVYTSNYGWAPVEVCPDYLCESIDEYKFVRNKNEEDNIEFVDMETKKETKKTMSIIGIVGAGTIVMILALVIKKKRDEYKERLKQLGIDNNEQLKLLRDINSNYLLLKQYGFVNTEVELIMLRIRFSTRRETREDLEVLLKRVEYMKQEQKKNNLKNRIKRKIKKDMD